MTNELINFDLTVFKVLKLYWNRVGNLSTEIYEIHYKNIIFKYIFTYSGHWLLMYANQTTSDRIMWSQRVHICIVHNRERSEDIPQIGYFVHKPCRIHWLWFTRWIFLDLKKKFYFCFLSFVKNWKIIQIYCSNFISKYLGYQIFCWSSLTKCSVISTYCKEI